MRRFFRKVLIVAGLQVAAIPVNAQLTLDECQSMARDNYPLLKRQDLIRQTTSYSVENISKGFLPQVSVNLQATYQSSVATLPEALSGMMAQQGYAIKGLEKDQYRLGVDVNQLIWDGGSLKSQKEVVDLEGKVATAQTDVDLYAIRDRVNNLYFGILLIDEKLKLNGDLQKLLLDNCRKMETRRDFGTATQAQVDVMKAEYLKAKQDAVKLNSMKKSYQQMLAIFIAKDANDITNLEKPSAAIPLTRDNMRPELRLFDAQLNQLSAKEKSLDAGLMPRLSAFAQGFYGYPGYDMFNDMANHSWTLNGIVGVRLSWNIGKLYTHKNDKQKLALNRNLIETARETFLFNNSMQQTQETEAIEQYRQMMLDDDEIIALRQSVRQSAESKLEHGVIDVNDLLQEITRENQARIDHSTHEIEMLKSIHELRNTINQ